MMNRRQLLGSATIMAASFTLTAAAPVPGPADAPRTYDAPAGKCTVAVIQAMVAADTVIESAAPTAAPVPHCRIDGYVTTTDPGPNKVRFRLQLPDKGFNGRFIMAGLGGAAGYVPTDMQIPNGNAILAGFAMAGTDTGHSGEMLDWSFIRDNPAQSVDYVHRGGHVSTVAMQKITRDYYAVQKLYRYHSGCSGGGRMGVQAAERHPEDYDGILIGAPGRSTATMLMFMWATKQMAREPGAWLSPAKLGLIEQKVTAQCDALDGAKDSIVQEPGKCHFKPEVLQCKGADGPDCLTAPEIRTFKAIAEGPKYPDGTRITGGMPITNTAAGWMSFLGATPPPWPDSISLKDMARTNAATIMGHVMSKAYFGPDFDYFRDFDFNNQKQFDAWWAAADRTGFGRPSTADLSGVERANTKIIWWHGVSDAGPTLDTTLGYFRDAQKSLGGSAARLDKVAKLYEVPGMLHCGSGTGPDDVPDQLLQTLIAWTEKGVRPGPVVTGRGPSRAHPIFADKNGPTTSGVLIPTSKGADRDFLLCPAPQVARFNGKAGGENDAANWSCVKS